MLYLQILDFRRHLLLCILIWKSNLNEITGDHANENYEVNMWGKYPLFEQQPKKNPKKQCFIKRYNQYAKINYLIADFSTF